MIGWKSTYSRDYDEAVRNGRVDEDLEDMRGVIEERIKERDGTKRCPVCGGPLEAPHVHVKEGVAIAPVRDSAVSHERHTLEVVFRLSPRLTRRLEAVAESTSVSEVVREALADRWELR